MVRILKNFLKFIVKTNKKLPLELKQADVSDEPYNYIFKSLGIAILFSLIILVVPFFILLKEKINLIFLLPIFFFLLILVFYVMLKLPLLTAKKRKNEIESDLLYSARHLLLKMRTGSPLITALIDVSKLHTKSSKYFKDIASRIYLGEPLEEVINYSYKNTPSPQFKKVLRVIKDSLETGVDIKTNMEVTLNEIKDEQLVKLETYGKKINSLSMFYMIVGVIAPSLGSSVMIIAASFANINITMTLLIFIFALICILQYIFIAIFKSSRPLSI